MNSSRELTGERLRESQNNLAFTEAICRRIIGNISVIKGSGGASPLSESVAAQAESLLDVTMKRKAVNDAFLSLEKDLSHATVETAHAALAELLGINSEGEA